MEKVIRKRAQRGFADLGISLLVLALGGTVALASNHIEDKKAAAQQENVVFEAQLGARSENSRIEMREDKN